MLLKAKQSPWWRTIKPARARWAEVEGDQRGAVFGYYLLLSLLPLTILLVTAGSLFVEREVANFANFNVLYGARGAIVAFFLWLYLSSCLGVFGVCFCGARAEVPREAEPSANNLHA